MITAVVIIGTLLCVKGSQDIPRKQFIYDSYPYDKVINLSVNNGTEQIMDFYEENDLWSGHPTRIHVSSNDTIPPDYPVFITATQQKGVAAWELPLVVQNKDYQLLFDDMARTLCPHDAGPDLKVVNRPSVHITTENPSNTSVNIQLKRVKEFYLEVNKEIQFNVTPSTPKYYYFSFDQNPSNLSHGHLKGLPLFNYTIPKSVILIIDSDDDYCATVSIQDNSCPVFDNEKEISYQGYHLTMTSKGGITLTQSMFPRGFYVVFIVRESDTQCLGESGTQQFTGNKERLKTFNFKIIATVSYKEYVIGALVLLCVVVLVAAFVLTVAIPFRYRYYDELMIEEEPVPSTSQAAANDDVVPIINDTDEYWSNPQGLTVSRLTQAPPDTLARRSDRYFWGALTLAVVYALPVVQLLFTYQQMVFATGNQDLCYYNFLCAHPLWFLSDSNHVYSNIGYVILGGVFLLQVRARQRNRVQPKDMGIPQHYGLLYSMGLGLCMEGFLSACYHLCPNKMNFQFDSSFMYVIAVLVMIKLYQNRHSDLIPSAHSTFMLIALIMSIGLFGILFPSIAFSVLFTILHLLTCLLLTVKIYYAGSLKLDRGVVKRAWDVCRAHGRRTVVPTRKARALLLALANAANWTFAIYSAIERNEDFARQLLAILMGNAILYTMFYICMKLIHRERILIHTWVYFILAHVAWFLALSQFVNGNTRWSVTPAQSRRHNGECTIFQLLDKHDAWHAASAAAMFLSFNILLTLDDALVRTRRAEISTF